MKKEQLYGMNIHYRYYELEYFFEKCCENGIKKVELWLCPQHFYINSMWNEDVEKLRKLTDIYEVEIACICPEQNNPKPNNIAARTVFLKKNTKAYFHRVIELAGYIGCKKILGTPGWNYYDEEEESARCRAAEMLQDICDDAKRYEIQLAMESIWNQSSNIANTKEKVLRLKKLVNRNNFKLTLDMGAVRYAGETISEWFELFGKDIIHCHFTDGIPAGHMPWGMGKCNMEKELAEFQKYRYQGGFSMEYVDRRSFISPEKWDRQTKEMFEKAIQNLNNSIERGEEYND